MPNLRYDTPGDQYVTVMIEVPKKLTAQQKQILEEYARGTGEDVGIKTETIKDKIKKVFK